MANTPKNFEKINNEIIRIGSDEFTLETDGVLSTSTGHVWVIPNDEAKYGYAMYFKIDWSRNQFEILKAFLGHGKNFESAPPLSLQLHKNYYETKAAFLKFITEYAELNLNAIKR